MRFYCQVCPCFPVTVVCLRKCGASLDYSSTNTGEFMSTVMLSRHLFFVDLCSISQKLLINPSDLADFAQLSLSSCLRKWPSHVFPRANSVPSRADSIPSRADSVPSRADSVPSRADSVPSRADSVPPRADSNHFAISIHFRPLRRLIHLHVVSVRYASNPAVDRVLR